jgi:hypothetical protein
VETYDNNFVIASVVGNGCGKLRKIQGTDGSLIWEHEYDTLDILELKDVIEIDDGDLLACGGIDQNNEDAVVIRFDSTGVVKHILSYGGNEQDVAWELKEISSTTFYAAGFYDAGDAEDSDINALLIKCQASGDTLDLLWTNTYTSTGTTSSYDYDKAYAMDVTPDGGCFLAALWCTGGRSWAAKIDNTGAMKYMQKDFSQSELSSVVAVDNTTCIVADKFTSGATFTVTKWAETMICGDANGDGDINAGDAVFLINNVQSGGPSPDPLCLGDANSNDMIDIGDAVYIVNHVFKGGPLPCTGCGL